MAISAAVLPENILRCLSAADRKSLGKAGMTAEEALAKAEIQNERQLSRQIVALLRLKGIEPIVSATNRKTTNNLGTPDILFAIRHETPFGDEFTANAWELKFGKGERSKEQLQMAVRLSTPPNGWRLRVIKSVDEALAELRIIGIR